MSILIFSCSGNKGVYWCGDHPCINKKEKEAYFKKDTEIQKLLDQAKLDEKKRVLSEKELAKQIKLEEKRRIKEEKELAKQIKLEEKRRIKEEKELAKQIKFEKKSKTQKKKKTSKKESVENVLKVENVEISENKFDEVVKKIIMRNNSKPYPEINDIQK